MLPYIFFMVSDQMKKHLNILFPQWWNNMIIFTIFSLAWVFYFAWRKIHSRCFVFVPGCNFSDAQLMHALGPVIYIQLGGLMNGKAMHVMRLWWVCCCCFQWEICGEEDSNGA